MGRPSTEGNGKGPAIRTPLPSKSGLMEVTVYKEEARPKPKQCFSASLDEIIEDLVLKHFPGKTWKIANCCSNSKYPLQKESQDPIFSEFPCIVSHQAHFALTNDATCDLNPTKCGEMMWVDGCCFRGARVVWHAQLNAQKTD